LDRRSTGPVVDKGKNSRRLRVGEIARLKFGRRVS